MQEKQATSKTSANNNKTKTTTTTTNNNNNNNNNQQQQQQAAKPTKHTKGNKSDDYSVGGNWCPKAGADTKTL